MSEENQGFSLVHRLRMQNSQCPDMILEHAASEIERLIGENNKARNALGELLRMCNHRWKASPDEANTMERARKLLKGDTK